MREGQRYTKRCRRWHVPGQAHALTFSCYRTRPFLAQERTCDWLVEALKESPQGTWLLPHNFDFEYFQPLKAPWYSGMTQGDFLCVLVRTYELTDNAIYMNAANEVFRSFLRMKDESEPWTVFEDKRGCYWIEEYPVDPPSMTLNGFIFGLYGVFEYYQLTKSEEAYEVLQRSLSTIVNYIPYFRRRGLPSLYGFRFRHFSAKYHMIHIGQLRYLYSWTHDSTFSAWADSLQSDWNDPAE